MTREEMQKEVVELNKLLPWIDMKAVLEDENPDDIFIGLIDLQGVNFGGIEQEKFYSAKEVADRLDWYWDDTFLDGEVCCKCDHDFDTYEEAEAVARSTGYVAEADAICLMAKIRHWIFEPSLHAIIGGAE